MTEEEKVASRGWDN